MWSASITLLVLLGAAGCRAELPKSTPQCSKDWGGWWDAYNCGNYPLHWAVASGNMKKVKELLKNGADINKRDEILWTPLVEAAFFGKQHISVYLIRRGASFRDTGYMGINIVKMAKMKWCVGHSHVNTCPTTLYDYDRTIEVLVRGCEWTECVEGFKCDGRQCWPDKCHGVECGTNAGCVVENRKAACRCNAGFIGEDPKKKCQEISGEGKTGLETGNLVLDRCPEGYYIFGSQCLYIDDLKAVTWNAAVKICKKKMGVLAKIEKPQNFTSYLNELYPRMSFWLGANDKKKEGVWRWQSGELLADGFPWGKNNRGKQQPNNGGNNEHCMSLKYFNPELGVQYVDNKCSIKHHYVCEAPRNYVDELSSVINTVYSTIESNSSAIDNNNNNSTNNTASENQRENNNVNNESESSNDNSVTSDIDQDNNSSISGNSESRNDNSVTIDIEQNSNITGSGNSESSNDNSASSDIDQNSNSTRSDNTESNYISVSTDIDQNRNSTRSGNSEIRYDNSVSSYIDQNSNSTRSGNTNINLTDTRNHRNKRSYGEYDSSKYRSIRFYQRHH